MFNNFDNIIKKIKKSKNVFIVGHKNLDLDALGASIGVGALCKTYKKEFYIVIDDSKNDESIDKALNYFCNNNLTYKIGKYKDFSEKICDESLLVIVDTYSEKRIQNTKLLTINNKLIIDHHLFGKPLNETYYIDANMSSACEILATILKKKKININKYVATVILSGILIDTNSYSIKTAKNTFDMASYLILNKADNSIAHSFNKTKLSEYKQIQEIIFKTEFHNKTIAINVINKDKIISKSDLAKIADTLIQFESVEACFVIGFIGKNKIGMSARSVKINVGKIMTDFNGGGRKSSAATEIEGEDLNLIKRQLLEELDENYIVKRR